MRRWAVRGLLWRVGDLRVVERRVAPPPPQVGGSPASGLDGPELPEQTAFFRAPARFGNVPVERDPLGWEPKNPGFRNHYPIINLPTQIVDRVSFGAPDLEPNRLIWGDNLHVMRQLPSASIDLIYIDPPFFSNRTYNVIWGDQNEERSFSDIWEGGLDGYLIWLNARLYEMKRLLKPTGSIYVHCDWHASHYIKVEMDKIFGYENFRRELIWDTQVLSGFKTRAKNYIRGHDTILFYAVSDSFCFNSPRQPHRKEYLDRFDKVDERGRRYFDGRGERRYLDDVVAKGKAVGDVWYDIMSFQQTPTAKEKVGYPTQKPETLAQRVVETSSNPGDLVLDAFGGGGGIGVVAQQLGRRWIVIDQSRVAVAVAAERLKQDAFTRELGSEPVADFTVEQWGVYEAQKLAEMPSADFRQFVLHCYDARIPSDDDGIHGYKGSGAQIPVWVGSPGHRERVSAADVNAFAEAITKLERYRGDEGLRDGVMLAWGFQREAMRAVEELRERDVADLGLVRLSQISLDSAAFREHIDSQSTERGDYSTFLTFVQPPEVQIAHKRLKRLHYGFDAGDSQVFNAGAEIINVQWDFDHRDGVFQADRDAWLRRKKEKKQGKKGKEQTAVLDAQHTYKRAGRYVVACKVQDDQGGEGMATIAVDVK